jgi:hypothetical protein
VSVKTYLFSSGILIPLSLKFFYPFSTKGFTYFLAQILVNFPNLIEMMTEARIIILPFVATPPFCVMSLISPTSVATSMNL